MFQYLCINVLLIISLIAIDCDDTTHTYELDETVTVWYNHIGPYHNPHETYEYYSLPLCQPDTVQSDQHVQYKSVNSIGTLINGDNLIDSGITIKFKHNSINQLLCKQYITTDNIDILIRATQQHYWYEMYIDELPVWAMLGEYMQSEYTDTKQSSDILQHSHQHQHIEQSFLYTHRHFTIGYNQNQIMQVNLTSENLQPIKPDTQYDITYTVQWVSMPNESFDTRFNRYLDIDFFEHNIHWFSLFNSFMMVIFLCGLVTLILMRTLKQDYARYSSEEYDLESVTDSESGWKQIHGDVFRPPRYLVLYCAVIGIGYQLLFITLCTILYTLFDTYYDERGSIMDILLILYSTTSCISGYTSAQLYKRYGGLRWKQCMVMTVSM